MKQSAHALKWAGAAALAGSTQAYGQIVPINLPPTLVGGVPGTETAEYFNFSTGSTLQAGADFKFEVYNGNDSYFFSAVEPVKTTDAVVTAYSAGFYDAALKSGDKVTSASNLVNGYAFTVATQLQPGGAVASYQQPNVPQYLGIQFDIAGVVHNGYLKIESVPYVSATQTGGLYFLGGAYNAQPADALDNAGDITVPEPNTLSALALGAAALGSVGLLRRRRSVVAVARN